MHTCGLSLLQQHYCCHLDGRGTACDSIIGPSHILQDSDNDVDYCSADRLLPDFPRECLHMCPSLPERLLLLLIDRPCNGESLGAVYGYYPLVVARRLPYSASAHAFPLSILTKHQPFDRGQFLLCPAPMLS
jgi:hypothetical protein